jgi:hypothetical protein
VVPRIDRRMEQGQVCVLSRDEGKKEEIAFNIYTEKI